MYHQSLLLHSLQLKSCHNGSVAKRPKNIQKVLRSPICRLPQSMWQTCGRRLSGQIRPKLNFLACIPSNWCGKINTVPHPQSIVPTGKHDWYFCSESWSWWNDGAKNWSTSEELYLETAKTLNAKNHIALWKFGTFPQRFEHTSAYVVQELQNHWRKEISTTFHEPICSNGQSDPLKNCNQCIFQESCKLHELKRQNK